MEEQLSPEDEYRRQALIKLLTMGALTMSPFSTLEAGWWGLKPQPIGQGKSIFSLEGEVRVNNTLANLNTRIQAGDSVRTGSNSEAVFVVGSDSFIMRSNSELQIEGSHFLLDSIRLLSGGLLSVFGQRKSRQPLNMSTMTATIGIRGTGVYIEAEPDLTYLCTCYGSVELQSTQDPNDTQTITTMHHDAPKYISDKQVKGSRIRKAPFINHTDPELKMLEALVGREVPFGLEADQYRSPRRDY